MSTLVDPALFLEWVLWNRPQLTESEQRAILRLRNGSQQRVGMDFIDEVMTRAGAADQMQVFYPFEEQTCRRGHLWAEHAVYYNGIRYCAVCHSYLAYLRRGPQLRLF